MRKKIKTISFDMVTDAFIEGDSSTDMMKKLGTTRYNIDRCVRSEGYLSLSDFIARYIA
ncbi:MAG: hypothetical protein KAS32_14710 [Candidatus Peribacteraceae bacterium]|nr:hypothetical protein [Candidatus Peribacteraceae bacterium]